MFFIQLCKSQKFNKVKYSRLQLLTLIQPYVSRNCRFWSKIFIPVHYFLVRCSYITRKKETAVLLYVLIETFDKTSFIKEKCHIFAGWICPVLFCAGMCVSVLGLVSLCSKRLFLAQFKPSLKG